MKKFDGEFHSVFYDDTKIVLVRDRTSAATMAVALPDLRKFIAETQITDDQLDQVLDNILRQVVCQCGNYRHHGVGWMPEGSGEGLAEAREMLRKLVKGE